MKLKVKKTLAVMGMFGFALLFALFVISCQEPENEKTDNQEPEKTQLSGNAKLQSVSVSVGALFPSFSPDTSEYTVKVVNSVQNITITVGLADAKAHVSAVLANNSANIAPSNNIKVPLSVGENVVFITITAEDGTTRIYTISVYREALAALINFNAADFNITGTGSFYYDGTSKTVSITAKSGKAAGAITVLYNGSASVPVNAGEYAVTFNVAAAEGSNAANGLEAGTIIINKAYGAIVSSPTVTFVGMNSVTLNAVTASNGQPVEYAVSTGAAAPVNGWQTDTTFTGLIAGTVHYFFARSASSDNYNEGSASYTTATTIQQAGVNIISYWADYDGAIGIARQDGEFIAGNTVSIAYGNTVTFTPNDSDYLNHKWTLNGAYAGNEADFTFDTNDKEDFKNYIVGLYVEKEGKPYFTQITVMIRPVLTGTVSITGTAQIEQTLTANTGSLGGSGTIFYQWNRDGIGIYGANSSYYTVQGDDAGYYFTVTVSRSGNSGSITSAPTSTVPKPTLTGTVSITGAAQAGQILTANTSNLGGSGDISYQWKSDGSIVGYSSTYTVQTADIDSYIQVSVTRAGNSGSVSASIVILRPPLTGSVSISITGSSTTTPWVTYTTLIANTSNLGGSGNISYQWKRDGYSISGANNVSYVPQNADFGCTITVTVTRSGNSGNITSEPTVAVKKLEIF